MKQIIYTCITNNYDELQDPYIISNDFNYICYTDTPHKSDIWEIRPILKNCASHILTSRFHKTIGANLIDADITIWQDAKITFIQNQSHLFDNKGITLIYHPKRNCIYDEAMKAIQLKKCDNKKIKQQIAKYKKEGMPINNGLYETAIVIRDKSQTSLNVNWWNEIKLHSTRDQISLPYLIWKFNIKPNILNIDFLNNKLFTVNHHPFVDYYERIKLL